MKESAADPHALKVTAQENMLKKLQHSEVSCGLCSLYILITYSCHVRKSP